MQRFKRAIANIRGWRTGRKLVVFQSDDWWSVRTSSAEGLDALREAGVKVDNCHYMMFDSLESGEDLETLFELLGQFFDGNGRNPVITANCLAANPDFGKIERSGFSGYYAEPSIATTKAIPGCEQNLSLWRRGIQQGVCFPQCHGREHLNVPRWMEALRSGDCVARVAFAHGMFGVSSHTTIPRRPSVMAALDFPASQGESKGRIVSAALDGFQKMFDYQSRSFIAPNYVWNEEVEHAASKAGVNYLQSGRVQWFPTDERGQKKRRRRFQGQRNRIGQRYVVRNVEFEPSSDLRIDWVDRALSDIDIAFKLRKPVVVSTHRVNFVGSLSPANRARGLESLEHLLTEMLKRWPDIEFLNTVELGELMSGRSDLA